MDIGLRDPSRWPLCASIVGCSPIHLLALQGVLNQVFMDSAYRHNMPEIPSRRGQEDPGAVKGGLSPKSVSEMKCGRWATVPYGTVVTHRSCDG